MRHRIPTPGMADRVFTILLASGRAAYARREFFNVTVPLDALPAGLAPAARFPARDGHGGPDGKPPSPEKFARGAYVAVERVRCVRESEWREDLRKGVPGAKTAIAADKKAGKGKKGGKEEAPAEGKTGGGDDKGAGGPAEEPEYIYWDMATTADAGGKVPPALQKMGLAAHVVIDVGLLLKWVQKNREAQTRED
jgi:hypothetical protein